jgi:hypothetical protein
MGKGSLMLGSAEGTPESFSLSKYIAIGVPGKVSNQSIRGSLERATQGLAPQVIGPSQRNCFAENI